LGAVEIVQGRKRLLRWRPEVLENFVASREKPIETKRVA
jgi:hypothetical protein